MVPKLFISMDKSDLFQGTVTEHLIDSVTQGYMTTNNNCTDYTVNYLQTHETSTAFASSDCFGINHGEIFQRLKSF